MRKLLLFLTVVLLSFGMTQPVGAQTYSIEETNQAGFKKEGKYALLVDNSKYLMASIFTGQEYKKQKEQIQFEVVLIGAVVKELAENNELANAVLEATKAGVRIVVCEFAMNNLGVKKEDLPTTVDLTPNGFTYYFGLQELGFNTISL